MNRNKRHSQGRTQYIGRASSPVNHQELWGVAGPSCVDMHPTCVWSNEFVYKLLGQSCGILWFQAQHTVVLSLSWCQNMVYRNIWHSFTILLVSLFFYIFIVNILIIFESSVIKRKNLNYPSLTTLQSTIFSNGTIDTSLIIDLLVINSSESAFIYH